MNTLHPAIKRAALRFDISPNLVDEYQGIFDKCAEWFAPRNRDRDEYDRARVLYSIGLLDGRAISRRQTGGSFRGHRIEFKQAQWLTEDT